MGAGALDRVTKLLAIIAYDTARRYYRAESVPDGLGSPTFRDVA